MMEVKSRRIGRPPKYSHEMDALAHRLSLLGLTDAELASALDVDQDTINRWKKNHPSFYESIMEGKEIADGRVAEKLYHRAMGYSHPAVKIFQHQGEVIREEYTEHYPPDTQAASLWLRNRQPKKWRDKQVQELVGKDDGPVEVEATTKVVIVPAKVAAEVSVEALERPGELD